MTEPERVRTVPKLGPRVWWLYFALAVPKTLAELTREAGIVESAVRAHLKKLEEHTLVASSASAFGPVYIQARDLDPDAASRLCRRVANSAIAGPADGGELGYRDGVMPAPASWPAAKRPRSSNPPKARSRRPSLWTFYDSNTTGVSWASAQAGWVPTRVACLVVGRVHVFAYARLETQDHSYRVDDSLLRIANGHRPAGTVPNLVWIRQSIDTLDWSSDQAAAPASFPDGWLEDAHASCIEADRVFGSIDEEARFKREAVAKQIVAGYGTFEPFTDVLTAEIARGSGDALILRDQLRQFIGSFQYPDGPLVVMGERYRSAAITALKTHAVDVEDPGEPRAPCLPGRLVTSPARNSYYPVELCHPDLDRARVGRYDAETGVLYVVAEAFGAPSVELINRHGFEVNRSEVVAPIGTTDPEFARQFQFGPDYRMQTPERIHMGLERAAYRSSLVRDLGTREPNQRIRKNAPSYVLRSLARVMGDGPLPNFSHARSLGGAWTAEVQEFVAANYPPIQLPDEAKDFWGDAKGLSSAQAPVIAALLTANGDPAWWRAFARRVRDRFQADFRWMRWNRFFTTVQSEQAPADSPEFQVHKEFQIEIDVPSVPSHLYGDLDAILRLASGYLDRFGGPADQEVSRLTECLVCNRTTGPLFIEAADVQLAGGADVCSLCSDAVRHGSTHGFGKDGDTVEAVKWALRNLTTEFGGPPLRRRLSEPLGGEDRATSAISRMCLPYEFASTAGFEADTVRRTWTDWLREAGVIEDDYRPSRGVLTVAKDGHKVRSLLERNVDDWFTANSVPHKPEPPYPRHATLNTTGLRADWELEDGTFVEAAGMLADRDYAHKIAVKVELAEILGLNLVVVSDADLGRLPELFSRFLASDASGGSAKRGPADGVC